ncbi:MAG: hypothetical protein ACLRNW_14720 [Neglectibacter sp.]
MERCSNDLKARGLISAEWVSGRPVLSCVVLNLEHLAECYQLTGRTHPKELAQTVIERMTARLSARYDRLDPGVAR